jgi:hypothetical protein
MGDIDINNNNIKINPKEMGCDDVDRINGTSGKVKLSL